ncbi:MAG: glycosyl hydrolase [Limisphaerales bacterium]
MKSPGKFGAACALGLLFFFGKIISTPAADALAWPPITSQTKPWAFWWWMGSAVDKTNLAKELTRYHDAGLGGVHIIPIYGARGFEPNYISYLSPKWMDMLNFTVTKAHRLGMGVDMTLGTGWCFGGPTVSDQDANASIVVKTYKLGVGERLNEKFDRKTTQALVAFWPDGKSIDLTDSITTNGKVFFSPPGNWISTGTKATPPKIVTVYAISQKPSGQKVKRAAPGGEGWMLNPIYPQAMRDWLKWFDAAFGHYHGAMPRAVFQDSYEYRSDWSPDFFAQFEKLRGYKLQDELPALFANDSHSDTSTPKGFNNPDEIARVKYDYRRTVSQIMAQESEPIWISWAHRHGMLTRYQAHGSPANWLDLYADADIPETEMFSKDRNPLISKFASSAAHVAGHQLTSAETGTWLKEHFTVTLADLKYLADDMFLSGVNHIFYHGLCYSPDEAGWPGWHFYASTEMNPRNSIWRDVPALNEYIARVQSILQSGKPDNDILLYWPVADFWTNPNGLLQPMTVSQTAWFENQPIGKTAHELWNDGYAFDYVSDHQLQTAKVADGKIEMPGGDYKVIVVPDCKYIPLETFKQLFALAKNGATVVFQNQFPADVAGWKDFKAKQAELQKLREKLSGTFKEYVSGKNFGNGTILCGDLGLSLWKVTVPRETMTEDGLSFIRRSFDDGWNYFIANRGTNNFDGWITLARPAKSVAILDPMTGNSGIAAQNGNGQIHLQLRAGESVILRAFDHLLPQLDSLAAWNYFQTNGAPMEISGNWNVKFISGGPTLPAETQISKLASWTTFADTNAENFGGTAKYEITFDAPARGRDVFVASTKNYFLDLGDVCQSARVTLNGKNYGTLITPPFRVVVDNLKPTGNKLEVEVTSVDANRIRDLDRRGVKWKIFHDINFVDENYRPFDASNWPLTDSGLLGPVTLTRAAAF